MTATKHEIPVVAPRSGRKLEAVSPRLKAELIHPNKTGTPHGLRFSPDGKRLVAGDYPGGVVVVWDVATGKRLTTIEAGYGGRASAEYFALSPDWQTLYAPSQGKRKYERVESDGKRQLRWNFDGEVRTWDLSTGQPKKSFKHRPPRNIRHMVLSPDGSKFLTIEEVPGTYEAGPKSSVTLWEAHTGDLRTLPDGTGFGLFSPDAQSLITTTSDDDGYVRALKAIELNTGCERWTHPVADRTAWLDLGTFSPDGRLIVGMYRRFARAKKWDSWECWLKWYDTATGRESASFPVEKNDSLFQPLFSPDGQLLAAVNWRGQTKNLFLFSVSQKKLIRSIQLGEQAQGERLLAVSPVFSPDGKWLAVITRIVPEKTSGQLEVSDVAQPRIHLIDVTARAIRETLIAPPSFASSACFSPDGQTLASAGHGRVLLWDLSRPPGAGDATRAP